MHAHYLCTIVLHDTFGPVTPRDAPPDPDQPRRAPADATGSASAPSILRLDATAIKVLAHPLRSRLLGALRAAGPATATALAQRLETNTGATSYHLRKLATVGLVEETGEGHGRERWWRAATEMHGFTQRDVAYDPDARAAADWLRAYYLRTFVERFQRWLDVHETWPLEWQEVADASDRLLRLSPRRLAELQAEVEAVFDRYHDPDPDDADARLVEVDLYAFPLEPSRP
jgi:predicted ArsR family transcriptional regulator